MPDNKNNNNRSISLKYIDKTGNTAEYASFRSQEFSKDVFEDKKDAMRTAVSIVLGKSEQKGKIVVLSGESGTGKSTFLKQLLSEVAERDEKIVLYYLSYDELSNINDEKFQETLRQKNGKRKVLIIEDCQKAISQNCFILNSTDGLLSETYDLSYIFTTTKGEEISFRENRLGLSINFGRIPQIKAQEIAIKKNPKFIKTKIRGSMTILEIMKEVEKDDD